MFKGPFEKESEIKNTSISKISTHQVPVSGTGWYNLPLQRNICIRLPQLSRHSPITHWQPEMKPLLLRNSSSSSLSHHPSPSGRKRQFRWFNRTRGHCYPSIRRPRPSEILNNWKCILTDTSDSLLEEEVGWKNLLLQKALSVGCGGWALKSFLGITFQLNFQFVFPVPSRRSVGRLQSKNTLQFHVAHALKSQGCGLRLFSEFICRKLDLRFACLQAGACTLSGLHFRNRTSRSAECLTKLSNDLICP